MIQMNELVKVRAHIYGEKQTFMPERNVMHFDNGFFKIELK